MKTITRINKVRTAASTSIIFGFLLMIAATARGQEFKLAKSSGRLELKELSEVTIEGYNGNEIIFSSLNGRPEHDERAQGLRAISSLGLEDNTGLGLSVVDNGNVVEVHQLKKMDGPEVKIRVPKGVIISYTHTSPHGDDITFLNVESEIEVSTVHNGVKLQNVTGPMTVKTVHGEVEATFAGTLKSPISLVSVHGLVDVTLPSTAKVNLTVSTSWGEVFVDPSVKIELEKKDDEWVSYGSGKIKGKINGGGLDISLSSSHGNVYIRKN